MMKYFRNAILILALLAASALASAISAAPPAVTLEALPAALELAPDGEAEVVLVLRNASSAALSGLRLAHTALAGVEVESGGLPKSLARDSSLAIPVVIHRLPAGSAKGGLVFQLFYTTRSEDGSAEIAGLAAAKVDLAERLPAALDKLVEVKIETPLKVLGETQSGFVQVTARNLAPFPVTLTALTPGDSRTVRFEPGQFDQAVTLMPQTSEVFNFRLSLTPPYQSGDEIVYFTAQFAWEQDGRGYTGSQIVSKSIAVGVFAEQSDLMKLLGMPSFLVLPGFLGVMAFAFCWKRFSPKTDLNLGPAAVEFWILVVTVSIPLIFLYRQVSIWIGFPRQFPNAYSLADILILWVVSLGLGILAWRGALLWRQIYRSETPLPEDPPLKVLLKLRVQRSGLYLPQVQFEGETFLRFPPVKDPAGKVWLLPFIQYELTPAAAGSGLRQRLDEILNREEGERSIRTPEALDDLIAVLREAMRADVFADQVGGKPVRRIVLTWRGGERPFQAEEKTVAKLGEILLIEEKKWGTSGE
jgi:hypothetical protein